MYFFFSFMKLPILGKSPLFMAPLSMFIVLEVYFGRWKYCILFAWLISSLACFKISKFEIEITSIKTISCFQLKCHNQVFRDFYSHVLSSQIFVLIWEIYLQHLNFSKVLALTHPAVNLSLLESSSKKFFLKLESSAADSSNRWPFSSGE